MIFPLNKNVDNKNLICIMKLGGEHSQMKSFVFLSFKVGDLRSGSELHRVEGITRIL